MKISVCLASYNGEKYIAEQIKSILGQLADGDELIISDDSSTDGTLSIIESFEDQRIKVLPENKFYNPIYNFESAIKQAKGEVIVLSDQDDVWLEKKLDIIRQRFQKKPGKIYTIVLDGQMIDEEGRLVEESIFKTLGSRKGLIKNLIKNTYMGCCMAFSRDLLQKILPFPKRIPMHDSWIGLVAEFCGEVEFVPEKTIQYRRHPMNQSFQKANFFLQSRWRCCLAYHLMKRCFKK